jgi:hypothetical protein
MWYYSNIHSEQKMTKTVLGCFVKGRFIRLFIRDCSSIDESSNELFMKGWFIKQTVHQGTIHQWTVHQDTTHQSDISSRDDLSNGCDISYIRPSTHFQFNIYLHPSSYFPFNIYINIFILNLVSSLIHIFILNPVSSLIYIFLCYHYWENIYGSYIRFIRRWFIKTHNLFTILNFNTCDYST